MIAFAAALSSCSDDDKGSAEANMGVYDFVTLATLDASGSTFTLRKSGDSELITYESSYTFPNDTLLEVGDRLIIKYLRADGQPYTSGQITLQGYRYLDNYPQKILKDSYKDLATTESEPIKVTSLTRTGVYLNLQAQLSCQITSTPYLFCLITHEEDADAALPQVRIVYEASQPGENYMTSYASWDISALWDRPTCQGLEVIYTTSEGRQSQTFMKQE